MVGVVTREEREEERWSGHNDEATNADASTCIALAHVPRAFGCRFCSCSASVTALLDCSAGLPWAERSCSGACGELSPIGPVHARCAGRRRAVDGRGLVCHRRLTADGPRWLAACFCDCRCDVQDMLV